MGNQFKFGRIAKQINYDQNGEGSKDQPMDFKGNNRHAAGAPTDNLHILESLLLEIPVIPKEKRKLEVNKKIGRGQ